MPDTPPEGPGDHPGETARMSFGDHLEELRTSLLRGLIGVAVAIAAALFFAKSLLALIMQPLLVVQQNCGLPPGLMALSPPETFLAYLKIGFLSGAIIAMPWVLYQVWVFVAAGLYQREKRFVRLFIPLSSALFALGVAFLYWVVLPIVLSFFIVFSNSLTLPELSPSWLQKYVLAVDEPGPAAKVVVEPHALPLVENDPPEPSPGDIWVNTRSRELRVRTGEGLLVVPLKEAQSQTAVTSQFSLQFYISFVLSLALAFGLAFELPVVVVFLSLIGIVRAAEMARFRRHVIFAIFIAAAVFTPPDVISQVLLAIPMLLLFEGGLLAARLLERRAGT